MPNISERNVGAKSSSKGQLMKTSSADVGRSAKLLLLGQHALHGIRNLLVGDGALLGRDRGHDEPARCGAAAENASFRPLDVTEWAVVAMTIT